MPMTLFQPLDSIRRFQVHRYCSLWRIERTDGVNLLFTDHDSPITFNYIAAQGISQSPGSVTNAAGTDEIYTPVDSISSTAKQKQGGLQENNVDLTGIVLSAGQITENDLWAGRYREAKVIELLIDSKFPYAGYFLRNIYYIGQVSYNRETWKAQISGVPIWLKRNNGSVYSYDCRFRLYDPTTCKISSTGFTTTGTINSIVTQREVFTASGTVTTNDYYDYGQLTFTSGLNMGLSFEIKNSTGPQLSLQQATPFDLTVGDAFTLSAGCDHLRGTCSAKFNNIVNFGGFPFLPGNDRMISGPIG